MIVVNSSLEVCENACCRDVGVCRWWKKFMCDLVECADVVFVKCDNCGSLSFAFRTSLMIALWVPRLVQMGLRPHPGNTGAPREVKEAESSKGRVASLDGINSGERFEVVG